MRSILLVFGLMMGLAIGCSRSQPAPALYPVEGYIVIGGLAGSHAQMSFARLDQRDNVVAVAVADEHGHFRLTTHTPNDGVPAGEYVVTVVWPNASVTTDECVDLTVHDHLKGAYSDRLTSPLRATINAGPNKLTLVVELSAGSWSLPKKREQQSPR